MEGSEEESPWERSSRTSTSRGLDTACPFGGSSGGAVGTSRDDAVEEAGEDLDRPRREGGGFRRERRKTAAGGDGGGGEISLRQWLDRPDRAVEMLECLHIFRQVAESVSLAHSQGVVVTNVRPSCFVMSAFSRVSFIESASCSSSASDSSWDEGDGTGQPLPRMSEDNPEGDAERASDASCLRSDLADATQVCSVEERTEVGGSRSSVEERTDELGGSRGSVEERTDVGGSRGSVEERTDVGGSRGGLASPTGNSRKDFPLKQILLVEFNWYTSPEEAAGGPSTFASDIYRLGVLMFELFCTCVSMDEKLRTMANLRHRVLPPQLLLKWPKVASFCLWLLHPQPDTRPRMSEVLQSEFLNETRDSLEEREAAINLREEIEYQELLLEFLSMLRQRKQEITDKLHDTISLLSTDIEEVVKHQSVLVKKGVSHTEFYKTEDSAVAKEDKPKLHPVTTEDSPCSGSRKRLRPGHQCYNEDDHKKNYAESPGFEELKEKCAEGPRSDAHSEVHERILSKGSRMMKNFKNLEAAYFSTRCKLLKPSNKLIHRKFPVVNTIRGSVVGTEGSSVDDVASKESHTGWINPFLEGLCKYLSFDRLKVRADLKQGDLLNSSNLVCSLGFDRDREFFATAGVNRKIKIFECDMILNDDLDIHYPVVEMTSRSKLSSICWNNYIKSQIASSDFEGTVQVWDVTRSQSLVEMREHERRVWSVDFSLADPTKLASGSDDCTVKLWNINQGGSIGTIRTKANVCSVQFPPDSAHVLAIGSADHNVYCYDLRSSRVPLCTLVGHTKTVSYVKFVDSSSLVSASTDSSLKLWDLSTRTSRVLDSPLQTFTGHTNVKNFVGLSISDEYIATGSETNEVFVYHKSFPMPVLSYKFNSEDPLSGRKVEDASQFISCVCWRGQSSTLVAASSNGDIKLLDMV